VHLTSKATTPLEVLVSEYPVEMPNESFRKNTFVCRSVRSVLFAITNPSSVLLGDGEVDGAALLLLVGVGVGDGFFFFGVGVGDGFFFLAAFAV
jgi:hypothetical protein